MATKRKPKEVTPKKILDLLPIVADRKWTIEAGVIRDENQRCPVCSIVNKLDRFITYKGAAHQALIELGVDISGTDRGVEYVMEAADGVTRNASIKKLRAQMIKILKPKVIKYA